MVRSYRAFISTFSQTFTLPRSNILNMILLLCLILAFIATLRMCYRIFFFFDFNKIGAFPLCSAIYVVHVVCSS